MDVIERVEFFSKLEKECDVVSLFRYSDSNAWPHIKFLLSLSTLDQNIRVTTDNTRLIFKIEGLKYIFKSLMSYMRLLMCRKKLSIFLGASTGLLTHNGEVYDSYFPYADHKVTDVIYMINCANLPSMKKYDDYLARHNIVIENYLCAPIKWLLSKFLYLCIFRSTRFVDFSNVVADYLPRATNQYILRGYANFIAGYYVYRAFFGLLAIKDAYIVSAFSKSDMVAALKHYRIPVVEIQHGIIGRFHVGYNYSVKAVGLPTPDKVDVYNEFWRQDLLSGGYFSNDQVRVVGRLKYDLMDSFIKPYERYIVFTGQASCFEAVAKFLCEADEQLVVNNLHLIYKPHPKESPQELAWLQEQINECSNVSIYEGAATTEQLISQAVAHISIYSSCHFDAIHFLKQTFIFDVVEKNLMDCYAENFAEMLIKVKTIGDVIRSLR
jgi:hypothetical protein